ncbi:VirB4 family type IV secretion system protein [Haloechinothrix salitolerans]|uniref:VirB4 family type IV secretion system protein n=1 Tax=Haloechinothrix salitolerans TaxID=926830 RepID=A0ABW2BWT1_9PSEU
MRTTNTSRAAAASPFVPDAIEVGARHLQIGEEWVASFAVTGYPREVYPGWLQPLLTHAARVDVSLHIEPIDPRVAAERLRTQLGKLESGRRHAAEHGRLHDPEAEAATEDAHDLSDRLARGEGRLFKVGLYLVVHASSETELIEEISTLRALAASLLMDAKPTTYRSLQGWVTALPMGLDPIGMTRSFDTAALSAGFPFTSPDVPPSDVTSASATAGVLYGHNLGSQALVHWDRFSCENYNSVILGRSGAGKSYLVKLETLRSLYQGIEIIIIDPEDEYARLADAVGGTYFALGSKDIRLNPFDLPIHTRADGRRSAPPDALTRRSLFIHTLVSVLFGQSISADEQAVLDQAVTETYRAAGITDDSRTWTRQAPLLADLCATLASSDNDTAHALAARLHPFTDGAFSVLFNGPTTAPPDGHLLVLSLRNLPDELRPAGTLLTLDTVWRRVSNSATRRPRMCVVDEAWLLMQQQAGAEYLWRMAKSARKNWLGFTVISQDVGDVLGSDLGQAIIANAATQILLRQAPQAIDHIVRTFNLSEGERQFLLSAGTGQALLSTGTHRVALQAIASDAEHALITTDPAELAAMTHGSHDDAGSSSTHHELILDD